MIKKILYSIAAIFGIGALVFGVTQAFFTDTETSVGNILAAGKIDLKIDNTSYYNHASSSATSWGLKDLTENDLFFNFLDLKPGDEGEDTISLHVEDNDAWACMTMEVTKDDDVDCTEPENADDPTCQAVEDDLFDGELGELLEFIFWTDDGDNVFETDEPIISSGAATAVLNGDITLADADQNNVGGNIGEPLTGGTTYYIGKAWCFGVLTQNPVLAGLGVSPIVNSGVLCDGSQVGNAAQTDALMADLSFEAVQQRNNTGFQCGGEPGITPTITLTPTPTPTQCIEQADTMLVLDRSGSINSSELATLKTASKDFVDALDPQLLGNHAGMVSFSTSSTLDEHLTSVGQDIKDAIDALSSGGLTNLQSAISNATGELANPGDGHDRPDLTSPDFMVIVTDGNPNEPGTDANARAVAATAADNARAAGIEIYVVGIGSDVDDDYLRDEIADDSAHYFDAADFDDLSTILAQIASCE